MTACRGVRRENKNLSFTALLKYWLKFPVKTFNASDSHPVIVANIFRQENILMIAWEVTVLVRRVNQMMKVYKPLCFGGGPSLLFTWLDYSYLKILMPVIYIWWLQKKNSWGKKKASERLGCSVRTLEKEVKCFLLCQSDLAVTGKHNYNSMQFFYLSRRPAP